MDQTGVFLCPVRMTKSILPLVSLSHLFVLHKLQ